MSKAQRREAYLLSAEGISPNVPVSQKKTMELAWTSYEPLSRHARLLKTVYGKVGVDSRYSVLSQAPEEGQVSFGEFFKDAGTGTAERMLSFEKYAPALAHQAAEKAIASAKISLKDISHLISVSCTGFAAPGFDVAAIRSLKLDPSV